jgi:hypothetical protein
MILAVLLVLGTAAPVLANSELHPGGRLFFPLWDVSGGSATNQGRLTFIILTRLSLFGQITPNGDATDLIPPYASYTLGNPLTTQSFNTWNNCKPRNTVGTPDEGVNAVHFQYYGKTCSPASEIIYMSCADIDVILLTSLNNTVIPPRPGFSGLLQQGSTGALDIHFVDDDTLQVKDRMEENSLMGHAIISDVTEGWAAQYPAASAKATQCDICDDPQMDGVGGNTVGYEPYPMEVFIPWVLADGFPQGGGTLKNLLSLWAPGFMPGDSLTGQFQVTMFWYDGRERPHRKDKGGHSIVEYLGTGSTAIDQGFNISNFTCGHTNVGTAAENDGAPRNDTVSPSGAAGCDPVVAPDAIFTDGTHSSDDFDIQTSTPIGWWDIQMTADNQTRPFAGAAPFARSGRGMVGVVLSSGAGGAEGKGAAEAIRLWHKDPCEFGPQGLSYAYGPPHLRDRLTATLDPNYVVFFNSLSLANQGAVCNGNPSAPPLPEHEV